MSLFVVIFVFYRFQCSYSFGSWCVFSESL